MLRMTVYAILLIVITAPVWGLTEARLLGQSSSGRTAQFNLGIHDGIKEGDYAVIAKQITSMDNRALRIVPAAKARNVKINSNSSVWILYKIYDQELMVKNDKFVILSESFMLSGRRPPTIGRTTVVSSPKELKANAASAENNEQNRLGKLNSKYETMDVAHEVPVVSDNDVDLIDLDVWKENKNARYRSSLYKSPNKEEFNRQLRFSTFEKLVTAYLLRVNDPDFNYDSFYERQRKLPMSMEASAHPDVNSEYSRFLRSESKKSTADAKLFRSMLEKGERWSEDYSDEELARALNQVSVLQEKDRKLYVMAKPTRFAMSLDYGFNLNDAQTDKDTRYQRENRYSTEVDFEATPFLKHESLERFTVDAAFRLNYTAFEADGYNADLNEYSLSLGANWYPWYAPYAVESPVVFLGTYFRSGFAKALAPSANGETGNYTVMSVPGFKAGFKYTLKNRIGIRLLMSMETLKIERYEASRSNTILPERTNLVEAKMGVGLAYAF